MRAGLLIRVIRVTAASRGMLARRMSTDRIPASRGIASLTDIGRSAASIQLSTGDFYRGFPERSVSADRGAPKLQEAAADGTPVDAARGRAFASGSSCHRVFRARGRFRPVRALVAVRVAQIWWLSPFCHLFAPLRTVKKRRRGQHLCGCRPRSGACVRFFLSPGLPRPGPRSPGQSVGRGQAYPDLVAVTFFSFSARAQAAARCLRASRRQPSMARPSPTTAIDEGSGTTARTPVVSLKVNCWPPTVAVEVHSEPDLENVRPL